MQQKGDFFGTEGLRRIGQASFYIQAIEDVEAISIPYDILRGIIDSNDLLVKKYLEWNTEAFLYLENRHLSLMTKNATKRYLDFLKRYEHI